MVIVRSYVSLPEGTVYPHQWRFPTMWVPNSWMVYNGKSENQMDDLGP